jgi:hypothetical protein
MQRGQCHTTCTEEAEMEVIKPKDVSEDKATSTGKKPYHQPVVKMLGKLHLITQGTGGRKGDGAQGMTRMG